MTCHICTYNVRGLRDFNNRAKIFKWLKTQNQDITFLQETHSTVADESKWCKEWGGQIFFSHGKNDARGVMILLSKHFNIDVVDCKADNAGRVLYLKAHIQGTEYLFVNVYAPNCDDSNFFEDLFSSIADFETTNNIIGGDLNLVLDLERDKSGGQAKTNVKAQECLKKYMKLVDLCDIWRVKNPTLFKYTWRRRKPAVVQCRLDYFIIAQSLINFVTECSIGPSFMSDHCIVNLNIKIQSVTSRSGFWKLNCSHLRDIGYIRKIKEAIHECDVLYESVEVNKVLLWETIKMNIRSTSIQYACMKKRDMLKEQHRLEDRIKELEAKPVLSEVENEDLENNRILLEDLIGKKVEGDIVRSRARVYEEDEKSSKYFLSLEKSNQARRCINQLKDINGNIISEQVKIRKEIASYYAKLYSKSKEQCCEQEKEEFLSCIDKELNEEERMTCEGYITRSELLVALKESKNNKAPGIDGLPTDFYKVFWNDISKYMLDALNDAYNNCELSVNHRLGIISLIPKKEKDTLYIKNWRPITLLCADYKLASKVIANRLKKFLPKLINPDQCGFVQNRYIGQNIDLLTQIIEYTETNQIPAIVLGVDYAQAFDNLSWSFIKEVLGRYGFGNMLQRWIKLFYTNIKSVVNVNGCFTEPFDLQKGVKQGDPISPYLFILCAEVFAECIRKNQNIKGIRIGNVEHKISMLADDTNIFFEFCNKSLNEVLFMLDKFSVLSGLKINYDKSSAFCIGVKRDDILQVRFPIKWANDVIETLGVKIPLYNRCDIFKLNYEAKIASIQSVIRTWSTRNLSLRGKVIVIRSLLMSKLQYLISVLGIPDNSIIHRINRIVYKYLWNGSEKLKRSTVINCIEEGGLNVPDLESIAKSTMIKWVHRFIHAEDSNWKNLVEYTLNQVGGKSFFQCNLEKSTCIIDNINSSLWRNITKVWCELNFEKSENVRPNDVVWLNSNLGRELYDKESMSKGLLYVKQFYDGKKAVTYEELCTKSGVSINIILFHSIIKMIKQRYNMKGDTPASIECKNVIEGILNNPQYKMLSRKVYKLFLQRKVHYDAIKDKWQRVVPIEEDNACLFAHNEKVTIVNKLRSFQFRFLNRILYFNDRLFKCKLVSSTLCDFCNEAVDSVDHRYFYCRITQEFYHKLNIWIKRQYNTDCSFNNIHFIVTNISKQSSLADLIMINAKYYLFNCFIKKNLPTISYFKAIVINLERIERHIASYRNLIHVHEQKWNTH